MDKMALVGVILAGGRSSRMGGPDKALLTLGSITLIDNVIARLAPQVEQLVISSNADLLPVLPDGIATVPDADESRSGPLAGVLAGLRWAGGLPSPPQALISASVDTPFFPRDLTVKLSNAVHDRTDIIAVATCANRWHPTFALWPLSLTDALVSYLENGGRKVRAFIEMHPYQLVDFPMPEGIDPFFNINTPDDLLAAGEFSNRLS